MKKLLSLLGVGMLVAMWTGCGVTDPASSVTIKIESIGVVDVGGAAGQVTGTIETDSVLTKVTMKILDGTTDVSTSFTVSFTSAYIGKKSANLKTDMLTTIAAKAGTAAKTYTLSITAEAGSITSTSTKDFPVTGGSTGTPVTPVTLNLGGHANGNVGSSMELDGGTVLTVAEGAGAATSGVDLIYTYSNIINEPVLLTPKYVADSNVLGAGWANTNATQFNRVTVDFASITTKEQIAPLFDATAAAANAANGRVVVAANDVYVVKTDLNAYVLIKVSTVYTASNGTAIIIEAK